MVVSMYFKPIDMMWHGGQSPNWLPYRYSFLISFVLLTMAAMAFTKLKSVQAGHFRSGVLRLDGIAVSHLEIGL